MQIDSVGSLVKRIVKKLHKKGFVDIVFSTGFNKLLTLITTSVIVRILTKDDYGNYSYALNIVSIISIFSSIGLDSVMLQFASEQPIENREERNGIYKFCLLVGASINILFSVGTLIYAYVGPLKLESARSAFVGLSCVYIFQFFYKIVTVYHRVQLNNKKYAHTTNIHSIAFFALSIGGAFLLESAGVVLGRYIAFLIAGIFGVVISRKDIFEVFKYRMPDRKKMADMLKYGSLITVTNAIAEILYFIDIFVIGLVVGQSDAVADYKVAMTIPFALNAIPGVIVTFIYPYLARNKDNISWVKRNYHKVLIFTTPINLMISLIGFILAPIIVRIAFGNDYSNAVSCFRILMVSYFFSSSFRVISGNIIAMLRKVKVNLVLDSITSFFNIIIDYLLVKYYGSIGAAIASLSVVCLAGILSSMYLEIYFSKQLSKPIER
jgi:O-antigen/teichoic acid export membrane protein